MSDTRVSYCVSVTEGQRVTLGGPVLKLEGGEQVTVSEVSLVGSSGIELVEADFVALMGMAFEVVSRTAMRFIPKTQVCT